MQGTKHGKVGVFGCSTYLNAGGKQCAHNWVERDQVVAFVINTIRERLSANGQQEALRKVIRDWLKRDKTSRPLVEKDIRDLTSKLTSVERQRQLAYRDMLKAEQEERRSDATLAYDDLKRESRILSDRLARCKARAGSAVADPEAQVEASFRVLEKLHLFLGKVPDHLLRRTFEALGARLTIDFERTKEGRRKTIPVGGKLELGINGWMDVAAIVGGEAAKAKGRKGRAGRPFAGKERAEMALGGKGTPNVPSLDCGEGTLGVIGRGGQI